MSMMLPAPRSRARIRRRVMGAPLGCLHGPGGRNRSSPPRAAARGRSLPPAAGNVAQSARCTQSVSCPETPGGPLRSAAVTGGGDPCDGPRVGKLRPTVPDQAGHDHPPMIPTHTPSGPPLVGITPFAQAHLSLGAPNRAGQPSAWWKRSTM